MTYADTVRYRRSHPWMVNLAAARQRCNDPKQENYYKYGGRGIRCEITKEEIKILWERDGAAEMETPTLDRKDSKGHYTFENCRFLELVENSSAPKTFMMAEPEPA